MNPALQTLQERGFFKQCTNLDGLSALMDQGPQTFYVGVDPTGPSCHVGHLVPIYAAAHLLRAGHTPIVLMGGGTALIGDPSGKSDMRQMISRETIDSHIRAIQPQLARLLAHDASRVIWVNNAEWLCEINYIEFLRDIGRHFSVNRMLSFEAYKIRMAKGLTFLEFNYQLLQSYDFLQLNQRHQCRVQLGGDDQWGNIVAGVELVRRVQGQEVFGFTLPLVVRADGKKMGKTEKGSIFLDEELTSVYDFFQYWRNVQDEEVEHFLLTFTFLPVSQCRELCAAGDINHAKEVLAFEVTRLLHGQEAAERARDAARSAFSGRGDAAQMPGMALPVDEWQEGFAVVDLFVRTPLCQSKSEARRLIQQGGARLNGQLVTDIDARVGLEDIEDDCVILQAGKKRHFRLTIEQG